MGDRRDSRKKEKKSKEKGNPTRAVTPRRTGNQGKREVCPYLCGRPR